MRECSIGQLLDHYHALLFDAYGVLVNDHGALPGAVALIDRLNREGRSYAVVTNSAAQLPEAFAARLQRHGLPVEAARVVTSGMLLEPYFRHHRLQGSRCLWLGPAAAAGYVEHAGGIAVQPNEADGVEVIVIADEAGFDCLAGMNQALNIIIRRLDAGLPLHLLLCNPDLIYPVGPGQFGLTAGALAATLESVIRERYPGTSQGFIALGKPERTLFDHALGLLGPGPAVMVGDQLATDILGARRAGIDAALVSGGVTPLTGLDSNAALQPDWLLASL